MEEEAKKSSGAGTEARWDTETPFVTLLQLPGGASPSAPSHLSPIQVFLLPQPQMTQPKLVLHPQQAVAKDRQFPVLRKSVIFPFPLFLTLCGP